MIDVVRPVNRLLFVIDGIAAHLQHILNDLKEIAGLKQRILDAFPLRLAHLDVEFETAYAREVELARIEEHAFQQAVSSLDCGRIAGSHFAIDFKQGIDRFVDGVFL